ncbi:MAG: invasion associated locus B family protein [Rhodospirillales bacterium]
MLISRLFALSIAITFIAVPASAQQQQQLTNIQSSQNGDWTMKCGDVPNGGRLCEMTQVINNPRDGKPVMQAAVIKPPGERGALLRFIAPLGIWLRPGISLSIDGAQAQQMDFAFCLRQGCIAQMPLSEALVNSMKRGSAGTVTLQNIRRQKLEFKISLSGFTAGYDLL